MSLISSNFTSSSWGSINSTWFCLILLSIIAGSKSGILATTDEDERDADIFARQTLIPDTDFQNFAEQGDFSVKGIKAFAVKEGIHAGIIVGRLQKEGFIKYSWRNELKAKIEELQTASKKAKKRQEEYTQSFAKLQSLFKEESYEECTELGESLLGKYAEHKVTVSEVLAEAYLKLEKYEEASKIVNNLENEKTQYEHLYNFAKGMEAYLKGDFDTSMPLLEQVSNSTYKFKSNASSTIWKMRLTKWQWGVYILLLALVIAITPKIKDIIQTAQEKSKNQKLEKIKESGNYEANFKFLEERYTKDDVHNMKLVTLLYAAALQKKGDNAKAYELITDYLKKDSRSPLAKSIAGETAMALGETSMIALEQIEGLLKINENRSDVTNYLAKTYITQKADHKKAQEYIAKYISMNPGDTEAIKYLADVYISRQAYSQQSIKTFEKAIKNNPDISDYYVALMENHKAIGNTLEAERILETIKERFC